MPAAEDTAVWATEDEYMVWNNGVAPPNKKSRSSQDAAASRSKAIGKMFFKTKLCCKLRAGTCPHVTNCNFAHSHSIEELRRPPPNWQEIVAAHGEEPPREEFQIPSVGSTAFSAETPRSCKGRHCKKFYSDEGCPYGESCTFLHDEQSKNRESVVISLAPGGYGANAGAGDGGGVVVAAGAAAPASAKPSNWKTRICNKWEITGYCPFGNKCHFAHVAQELHRYGGGLVDTDGQDSSAAPLDSKQGGVIVAASIPHSDGYHMGIPSGRASLVNQRLGRRAVHKWKGPNKISRVYGDWIDDDDDGG